MYPLVRNVFVEKMIPIVIEHLTYLENRIKEYFPSISNKNNIFSINVIFI